MSSLAELGAASRALYRSLLRTACKMPDDHRRAFVLHRARAEFDKSRGLLSADHIAVRHLEGEIYRDQLELQAQHLTRLAQQDTLIPVDIRSRTSTAPAPSPQSAPARGPSHPNRPARPTRPARAAAAPGAAAASPPPIPARVLPLDRRKLVRAVAARRESEKTAARGGVPGIRRNRFMEGPEPSWIKRKREAAEEKQKEADGGATKG